MAFGHVTRNKEGNYSIMKVSFLSCFVRCFESPAFVLLVVDEIAHVFLIDGPNPFD